MSALIDIASTIVCFLGIQLAFKHEGFEAPFASWLARRRRRRELLRDAEELEQQAARLRRSTLTSMLDATGRHAPYAAAGLLALALFKPESRPVLESWGTPTNAEPAAELESKARELREEAEHA